MARTINKEDSRHNMRNENGTHRQSHDKDAHHRAQQPRSRTEMLREEITRIRQSNDLYERQSI